MARAKYTITEPFDFKMAVPYLEEKLRMTDWPSYKTHSDAAREFRRKSVDPVKLTNWPTPWLKLFNTIFFTHRKLFQKTLR